MGLIPWQATVQDDAGNAVPSPTITVRNASDDSLADIFDLAGSPKTNPFDGTTEGFVQFQVYPGRYKIEGAKDASTAQTWYLDTTIDADDINAGSINGIPIGSSSPSSGAFTSVSATGTISISSTTPSLRLIETDGTSTHSNTLIVQDNDSFQIQTRTSANVVVATDYSISKGASGALLHLWRIGSTEKVRLTSTGLGIGTTSPGASLDVADGRMLLGGVSIGADYAVIADDAVGTFTPPKVGGFAYLGCNPGGSPRPANFAHFAYDTGSSLQIEKASGFTAFGADVNVTTSDVTGTTGTDGKVTISVQSGVVKVENRSGGSRTFAITWL